MRRQPELLAQPSASVLDERSQTNSSLRLLAKDGQGLAECDRHQRRGRGCKDEWPRTIGEKIAENGGARDQRTAGPEGLSARVYDNHVVASLQFSRKASAVLTKHTRRMRF